MAARIVIPKSLAIFSRDEKSPAIAILFLRFSNQKIIDLLIGLLRGAVFHHGGVPKNCPLALMVSLLNGPFSDLNGPFPRMPSMGRFSS